MRERLLDEAALAVWLGVTPEWLRRHRGRLYKSGLPQPLPLPGLRRWDPRALDLWPNAECCRPHQKRGFLRPSGADITKRPTPAPPIAAKDATEEDAWAAVLDRPGGGARGREAGAPPPGGAFPAD